jgi:hypothetical protein
MWTPFWDSLAQLPQSTASFVGTLAGSTFGLLAILCGALFNAFLNRKRDERIRNDDRRALAAALKAELAGFHRTLTENTSDFKNKDIDSKSIMLVPDLSQSIRIEPQILDKIGLLTPETIQKIVAAYILVEQYHQSLVLNAGGQLQGNVTPNRRLISLKRENLQAAIAITEVTAEKIQEAIDSLVP